MSDLRARLERLWGRQPGLEDAGVRIVGVLALALCLGVSAWPVALAVTLVVLAGAWRRGERQALVTVVAGVLCLTWVLNALTTPGVPLWGWGPLVVTDAGVARGAERGVRLVGLVALARWAQGAIEPWGVLKLFSPNAWGGRWQRLALGLALVLRWVPLFLEEARRIVTIARLRQSERVPAAWLGLFVPMVLGAVRRAEEMAMVLDARGFGSGAPSQRWVANRRAQWMAVAVGTAVVAGAWLSR